MAKIIDAIESLKATSLCEKERLVELKKYVTSDNIESRENAAFQDGIVYGIELAISQLIWLQ